ncbi:N-acetyltransferase [Roseimicrobium sp. ORNL1]|uniref:GNAT family N-acetyltransferase n=1 Tax=Roseimicrobium sp. ORNL1 TaxID=2711231 RepID=UPI0013E1D718|nr:N-acetyltransferase [Roseimicrobium sp. ORNL1]QIF02716.1 GNAT family N-acetyltransferase [Roseimicrobium sp. ORNL1]
MTLKLRRATVEDFPFAKAVHHSSYREWVVDQFGAWDEGLQDRYFQESWDRWPYDIIEIDGRPVGFSAVEHAHDATHLREFALHGEFQGRGIGAAYLGSLVNEFHRPQKPVRLRVFKANQRAIALYRRIGFAETGTTDLQVLFEWPNHVGLP